ncbi:hypothetical protein E4U22_003548 [Claviceps purpurea]|uniref:Uncharacterized protein n=1 Tax=Claviceps purpurea (strain 20.1) TaxID=1111077 RepID=M1W575_CLAP2|nr:hypothetical protein E4U22_003548 [Claviceps purpurea]CCE27088.1 uncharacterized protein CPUR_00560 [Claviceps purpurea 20.1]
MADLDLPIALRRTRRNKPSAEATKQEEPAKAFPPPKTPRRNRKAVRFSEPGMSSSSGLTPMVRRTYLDTPRHTQRRRASTPALCGRRSSIPATAPTACSSYALHHTQDGRVERLQRRNSMRTLLNKLDDDQRHKARVAQTQIEQLKSEIQRRDREIYELQNATVVIDTERIWDLEQQIGHLRDELAKRPATPSGYHKTQTGYYENEAGNTTWARSAARDPFFATDGDDDDNDDADTVMMDPDGDHCEDYQFGEDTMAHLVTSTPSRARSSFPTPPATSPLLAPATPCTSASRRAQRLPLLTPTPPSTTTHKGVQASFPDTTTQLLEEELSSLQREVGKLTATLDSHKNLAARLKQQLATVTPLQGPEATYETTDVLEGKVAALLQHAVESAAQVAQFNAWIDELGFPGADAAERMKALTSGFRTARLELEYLTPGEVTLPLTAHGAQVLDLLLVQLRALATKSSDDDSTIDEYHELEQSLRQQLGARVSAMDELRSDMTKAQRRLQDEQARVQELEVGQERLRGAVEGYERDLAELEALVQRLDNEHGAQLAAKDQALAALEVRQLGDARRHGQELALRDSRVLELRAELDRVHAALRAAHDTICRLRVRHGGLETRRDAERVQAQRAVDAIKMELQRVLHMSEAFLRSQGREEVPEDAGGENDPEEAEEEEAEKDCGKTPAGHYRGHGLAADLQRGRLTKKRVDSGLGFLEEYDDDDDDDYDGVGDHDNGDYDDGRSTESAPVRCAGPMGRDMHV